MRVCFMGGVFLALFFAVGCTKTGDTKVVKNSATNAEEGGGGTKHDTWWCDEHGVPEKVCSMCDQKVAAEFRKKGDWCDKHERAKSQCFICDPKLREKFAVLYRDHYQGKEPPEPTENK